MQKLYTVCFTRQVIEYHKAYVYADSEAEVEQKYLDGEIPDSVEETRIISEDGPSIGVAS